MYAMFGTRYRTITADVPTSIARGKFRR